MSRLKVMLRGALISEIELNPEKEYIGGRKEGCDIRLQAEKGISREHFKLKFIEGQWVLSAISRFGDVFSGGQKVEQTELQHNQNFQVPPYEFVFLDVPDVGIPAIDNRDAEAQPNVSESDKTVIGAAPQVPYIKMVNSTGEVSEMLRLEVGDVWVAGRDPSCQIIIPDQRVSRRQFEIYKVNGAYTILDLASVNGTFLNGSPVSSTDPQTLKSGDAINVLDNTMYFELHDPNFRYKVEKIEVPPLQMDQFEEEAVSEDYIPEEYAEEEYNEEVPDIEEYDQYDVPQQLEVAGGGPFTGMPGPDVDPNQYYTFQAPPEQPAAADAAPATPLKKLMANKPLLIAVVILFLAGAYYLSEIMNPPKAPPGPITSPTQTPGDPFSALSAAQQKEVEELYSLAEQMYNQQKYDLAIDQIRKIDEILPTGYRDSEKIRMDSEQAIRIVEQQRIDDQMLREKEERMAKIRKVLADCEKIITPNVTSDEMSACLYEVTSLDPTNSEANRLREIVNQMEIDRRQKQIDAENLERRKAQMDQLFQEAEDEHQKGYAFKTIKKYEAVLNSTLPDTKKYKERARERIKFIQEKILEKSQGSMAAADAFFKEGKLKEAVQTLRDAVVYDPDNKTIKEKIDAFTLELTRNMKVIYQESIIDENYGIIENTDSRRGAKEKWKKITEMDLEDGEYYRKAVMKLRRYGVY